MSLVLQKLLDANAIAAHGVEIIAAPFEAFQRQTLSVTVVEFPVWICLECNPLLMASRCWIPHKADRTFNPSILSKASMCNLMCNADL